MSRKPLAQSALDTRARRAAALAGFVARRSRWRRGSVDNLGGFQIVDRSNCIVAGRRFDMTAGEVIQWCKAPFYAE